MSHDQQTNQPVPSTADPAFEAEARRRGRVFWRRQYLSPLPILGFVLLAAALFAACVYLMMDRHRYLLLCLLFADGVGLLIACNLWIAHITRRLEPLLRVVCPGCGGEARFETAPLPDTHIYLVCPQCHQRADTGFAVPYVRRVGARVAMGYNWQTRKMLLPQVVIRVRRPGKKRERKTSGIQ